MASEHALVVAGAVALMNLEAVARKIASQARHKSVAPDFGDDGSCGDQGHALVPFDNGSVRNMWWEFQAAVEECERAPIDE